MNRQYAQWIDAWNGLNSSSLFNVKVYNLHLDILIFSFDLVLH